MPIARPDPISPEENGSTIITTNRTFNQWSKIFAGDAVQTSAVLDRILHHCETVVIEGGSKAGMYLPFRRRPSVNHGVLESLNLISHEDDVWQVTNLGQAFLETVSEPKRKDEKPATAASK